MTTTEPGKLTLFPLWAAICAATAIAALLIANPGSTPVYATDMFGSLRDPGDPSFIAGHRGDRSAAPENTIPALQLAIDSTLDFVETDIVATSDHVPVLFHDATLDRTTDGTGFIAEHSLAELKMLDAGTWYAPEYAGTRIPTLEEFLAILAPSEKKALLELKGTWGAEGLAAITDLIERYELGDRVIFMSFNLGSLSAVAELAPAVPRAAIMRQLPDDPVAFARLFGVIGLVTNAAVIDESPGVVDAMHAAGYGVMVYTLNSAKTWEQARALGVDGIITDKPSKLDRWLAETAPGT